VWEQVILGRANLSVAMRRYQLRYCDMGNAGPIAAEARIAMLADLLGLTSWGQIAEERGTARTTCGQRLPRDGRPAAASRTAGDPIPSLSNSDKTESGN
jgi:hypothetical protein